MRGRLELEVERLRAEIHDRAQVAEVTEDRDEAQRGIDHELIVTEQLLQAARDRADRIAQDFSMLEVENADLRARAEAAEGEVAKLRERATESYADWYREHEALRAWARAAEAKLAAVRGLHRKQSWQHPSHPPFYCSQCTDRYGSQLLWPCPTAAQVGEESGGDAEQCPFVPPPGGGFVCYRCKLEWREHAIARRRVWRPAESGGDAEPGGAPS
jgi:hypothetical protein